MKRCIDCGRIPEYCNCKKTEVEITPVKEISIDLIDHILEKHGFRGWVSFIQSETQASGFIEKYWVSYYCEITDGKEDCKGTGKHYPTKIVAYISILSELGISVG